MSGRLLAGVLTLGLMACSRAPVKESVVVAPPVVETQSLAASAAALTTMQALIHFADDQASLSDSARTILDAKVAVLRANPTLRIVIVGYASQPGSEAYNLELGARRAEAARSHLAAQGIANDRIDIETQGEDQRLVEGPGEAADAENRRDQFQLVINSHNDVFLTSAPK